MTYLDVSGTTRWGLNAVLLLSVAVALYLGQSILIPMVIALLLAALLWPFARLLNSGVFMPKLHSSPRFPWVRPRMVKRQVPWVVACTFMVLVLLSLILLVPISSGVIIARMLQDVPLDEENQQRVYQQLRDKIALIVPGAVDEDYFPTQAQDSRVFQAAKNMLDPSKPFLIDTMKGVAGYGGNWLWQGVLILFILLFLLLEGRMLSQRVVEIFGPSVEARKKAVEALEDMASQVRTYLVWRTIVNFGLAIVLGIVYSNAGLRHPWSWALLTAMLCYIPYLGQIVAGIPPVFDAFLTCQSPWVAVAILVFYVVVITVEGYLIVPVVMGRPMQLNATTVLLSCLFWHLLWGTPGLFLAMPLMAAVKSICTHVPGWEAWANLMSTRELTSVPIVVAAPSAAPEYLEDTKVMTAAEAQARYTAMQAEEGVRSKGS
jgi:AI-2 transport protein TqsA